MKIIAIETNGYGQDGVVVKLTPNEFELLTNRKPSQIRYTTEMSIVDDWEILQSLRRGRAIATSVAEQLEAYAKLLRTETGARDVIDAAEADAKAQGGAS